MDAMIATLFDGIPNTTIILSTLFPNRDKTVYACAQDLNKGYRQIVSKRQASGDKICLAEMGYDHNDPSQQGGFLDDGIDPTDAGYVNMASVWWEAIGWALDAKSITPAAGHSATGTWADDVPCDEIVDPRLPAYNPCQSGS
jgi:hypothetical protein